LLRNVQVLAHKHETSGQWLCDKLKAIRPRQTTPADLAIAATIHWSN